MIWKRNGHASCPGACITAVLSLLLRSAWFHCSWEFQREASVFRDSVSVLSIYCVLLTLVRTKFQDNYGTSSCRGRLALPLFCNTLPGPHGCHTCQTSRRHIHDEAHLACAERAHRSRHDEANKARCTTKSCSDPWAPPLLVGLLRSQLAGPPIPFWELSPSPCSQIWEPWVCLREFTAASQEMRGYPNKCSVSRFQFSFVANFSCIRAQVASVWVCECPELVQHSKVRHVAVHDECKVGSVGFLR